MTAPDGKHLKTEKVRKIFGLNLKFWGRVRRNSFQLIVDSLSLVDPKLSMLEGGELQFATELRNGDLLVGMRNSTGEWHGIRRVICANGEIIE